MTIVHHLKLPKLNRTPAFYIHQYGRTKFNHAKSILFLASTTSISNTLSESPARTVIRRLRPVSLAVPPLPEPQPRISDKFERPRGTLVDNLAKFEVRTETSVRTATSKSIGKSMV